MAENQFLVLFIQLSSLPFIILSRCCETLNAWCIREDFNKCLKVIDSPTHQIPFSFLFYLVVAEDRRNAIHKGVDPFAMIRAVYIRIRNGDTQGASTIEQQFVRVITNRFERNISRKIREQVLAIAVSRRRGKHQIARAYLSSAFYGYGITGVIGLKNQCGYNLDTALDYKVLEMIARLKYPEPLYPSAQWEIKLQQRIEYIRACARQLAINQTYSRRNFHALGSPLQPKPLPPLRGERAFSVCA
jgi:penicillin-binding protein 1A